MNKVEKMFNEIPVEKHVYTTELGLQVCADSKSILDQLRYNSVDLIMTSPPFALLRKKSYGNKDQNEYVKWLSEFGKKAYRVLKPEGSFVLDLGGAYKRGKPIRSLYNYRVLINFCDNLGYNLAEEFFWFNPSKLPSPIEWVNKRKIRVKDAVNTVWWFSKTEDPKADVTKVLKPYSDRMKKLLENSDKYYTAKERPSEHDISNRFAENNQGAIPPNLLEIPNTTSNSHYLRTCKELERDTHPARFPKKLPEFFIKYLTEPGDLVLDIFSGSNTTGYVAEKYRRNWLSIEKNREYAILSAVRFLESTSIERIQDIITKMESRERPNLTRVKAQRKLF